MSNGSTPSYLQVASATPTLTGPVSTAAEENSKLGCPVFSGDKSLWGKFKKRFVAFLNLQNKDATRHLAQYLKGGVPEEIYKGGPALGVNTVAVPNVSNESRRHLYDTLQLIVKGSAADEIDQDLPDGSWADDGLWAWARLEDWCNPMRSQPRKQQILQLIKGTCQDFSADGIESFIKQKQQLASKLKEVTMHELLITGILAGMPSRFQVTTDSLLAKGPLNNSVESIKQAYLDKTEYATDDVEMQCVETGNKAFAAAKVAVTCGWCGKNGHAQVDCRSYARHNNEQSAGKKQQQSGESGIFCFLCKKQGHMKRDCPLNKKGKGKGKA
eukprot:gene356-89_t